MPDIEIIGVNKSFCTMPLSDGSEGSALHQVTLELSETPSDAWKQAFREARKTMPVRLTRNIYIGGGKYIIIEKTTTHEVKANKEYLCSLCEEANKNADAVEKRLIVEGEAIIAANKERRAKHLEALHDLDKHFRS